MRDHGSIGLFLGNGLFFFCGEFGSECLGLFLSCFCLVWGEQATDTQYFGWQSKGEDHFRSWFPFLIFVYSVTTLYCSDVVWSDDLSAYFFCFSSDPWSGIFFLLFSSDFWLGTFPFLFFLFFSSESKDGHSHPGSRFMVSWNFGLRFVEQLNMTYVRVWFGSGIKGDVSHYFHDTNATIMIWKFYEKLVMHAPMWTLKCRIFLVMWC